MKSVHSDRSVLCQCEWKRRGCMADKLFFHFDEKSGLETPRLDSNQRRFHGEGGLGQHSRTDAFHTWGKITGLGLGLLGSVLGFFLHLPIEGLFGLKSPTGSEKSAASKCSVFSVRETSKSSPLYQFIKTHQCIFFSGR